VQNGERVDPARACLSIDDPAVRVGEGIFETMRAEGGAVPLLDRHLDRLVASFAALEIPGMPGRAAMERGVRTAVDAAGPGLLRVRLTVTPGPTILVDVTPTEVAEEALTHGISAISLKGWWMPENRLAEHKTLARVGYRRADRLAEQRGADTALLLDGDGRLGEATTANVFAVIGGSLVTPPAQGLLPGVTRALVMETNKVQERHMEETEWRHASELILTSGVSGAIPLTHVDGEPVGSGTPGSVAARLGGTLRRLMS
jgi:branched-chain amino acid aminotransferase